MVSYFYTKISNPFFHPIFLTGPVEYHMLASRTHTLLFGQHVVFLCQKVVAVINRLAQHQKQLGHGLNIQIPSIYAYDQIHQQYLEHLPYWCCGGAGNNRIDINWPKMFFYEIFVKTGVNCNYIQKNGGLG